MGFCQIYTHSVQTHTHTHNRWWNIKINDWKRQWLQRSTIVSRKNDRTGTCSFIFIASLGCLLLASFSLSFAIVLPSKTKTIIAQSVVILTIRHFKPHIASFYATAIFQSDTQTHAGTDSIHLFLKYNIMTISSSPLRSIFLFRLFVCNIFFGRFYFYFFSNILFVSFSSIALCHSICQYFLCACVWHMSWACCWCRWFFLLLCFEKIDVMKEWLCIVRCLLSANEREEHSLGTHRCLFVCMYLCQCVWSVGQFEKRRADIRPCISHIRRHRYYHRYTWHSNP